MVRGTGKYKAKRGGGRSFSRHLQLDENGTAVAVDKWARRDKGEEDDESDESEEGEEEEEEEEEEESEDESDGLGGGPSTSTKPEMTRAERKAMKAAQKKKQPAKTKDDDDDSEEEEEDDSDLINPNRMAAKAKKLTDLNAPQPLSRREREAKEKQEAKEKYWKLHMEGKTDQAKADLARLAKIRKDREEAAAKRKAEAEAKQKEVEAKASASGRRRI